MSKIPTIASFAAAFCLAGAAALIISAAPQIASDAAGVTVELNGATILHRSSVAYPPAALREGVQGTVSVQVKLDSTGEVNDAMVLSGPDALRKAALESVLTWHFGQDVAGTARVVNIAFELPKTEAAPASTPPPAKVQQGTIKSIRATGLSEEATAALLAALPVHEGDEWNAESSQRAQQAVKAFDEHLNIRQTGMQQSPGATQVTLLISAQTIMVGGPVQAANIIRKTAPVYPAEAKAAHIQGAVQLSATIGTDGTVQQVSVLSGPAELTQAAVDAVQKWVYRPTLLNGNPTAVETTITVNFTLNQ